MYDWEVWDVSNIARAQQAIQANEIERARRR